MKPWSAGRALRRVGVGVGAAVLAAAAAGLALAALYLFASGLLGGMLAALVTAGGALVLAGFLALGSRCCRAWHRGARRRRSEGPEELADVLVHLLRRNAKKATLAALVAGVALGVSPQLRRSVIRLLREFSKSKP